jgi:hypothetical protein
MKKLRLLSAILAVIVLCNCNPVKDFEKIKAPVYNPDVAFPLVNTRFSIRDILNNFETGGYIDSVDDGIIAVVYRGKVFSAKGDTIYKIPSFNGIPVPPSSVDVPYPALGTELIKKIIFKSGTVKFTIQNKPNLFSGNVSISYNLPNFKKNNIALTQTFTLPANTGSSTQNVVHEIDLKDVILDLTNDKFTLSYDAKLISNNQAVSFPANELTFALANPSYTYIEGTLPNYQFPLYKDTVVLDIFKNFVGGQTYFADPRINLIVANSYGVPIAAETKQLRAVNFFGFGQDFTSVYNNYYAFPSPALNQVGQTAVDTFRFYGSNSNVEDVIAAAPREVQYNISAVLNPNHEPGGFLTDSSQFSVFVDVALPMWGRTTGVEFKKDFNADFSPFAAMDSAAFKLITENGFPLDLRTQLYFVTNTNEIIDSLFTGYPRIMDAATVDGNGHVNSIKAATNFASISGDRFANIKKRTKYLRLKAKTNTSNNGSIDVKFYTDYGMTVKLGVAASVDFLQLF